MDQEAHKKAGPVAQAVPAGNGPVGEGHLAGARCRVCGNDDAAKLPTRFEKNGLRIVECGSCGFTFIPPYYRSGIDYADYKDERVLEQVRRGDNWLKIQRHLLRFRQMRRFAPSGRLFDLGAGWGHFMLAGRQLGYDVHGVELSLMPWCYASEDLGLPVERQDFLTMPLEAGSYDIVTMWDVLEHIDAADQVIDRCATMLRPGGWMFIQVPAIDSFFARRQGARWNMMGLDHVNYFSRRTITRLLNDKGFEVVRIRSSIELKLLLMYTILPWWRKMRGKGTGGIDSAERQAFFNKAVARPRWQLKCFVFVHDIAHALLTALNIGEEMIVTARRR